MFTVSKLVPCQFKYRLFIYYIKHKIFVLNLKVIYYLYVLVHPLAQVHNQIVSASLNATITLSCGVEASPRSVNYWTMSRGNGDIGNSFTLSQMIR